MSLLDLVTDLNNDTAFQQAKDYAKKVEDSFKYGDGRNVGGVMGKEDFLMLLSAQLRHQDPLNPESDSAFASQLAQFSSLEQMQNMNATLDKMNSYQAYSLVGKFVMAEAYVDGQFIQIPGVVDSIFTKDGISYAQIGEYEVPVASIKEVFDTDNLLTTEMFLQTASQLIGRMVIAEVDGEEIEGIVTRVLVDQGSLLAQLDTGADEPVFVPVNTIVDIREAGSARKDPKPQVPPEAKNFIPDPDSDGFFEYSEDFSRIIGRWDWDKDLWMWVYTGITEDEAPGDGTDPIDGDDETDPIDGDTPVDDPGTVKDPGNADDPPEAGDSFDDETLDNAA